MANGRLDEITRVIIDHEVIPATLEVLRAYGKFGCEGLVLWLGQVTPPEGRVSEIYVPKQSSITREDGVGYFVEADELFALNQGLSQTGLRLLAQVHSHPGRAYHSEADDRYAIVTAQGGFSLVVPNFGDTDDDLREWAVYRLAGREWGELSEPEIARTFHLDRRK